MEVLAVLGRYALTWFGAYAVGKGWVTKEAWAPLANDITQMVVLLLTAAPAAYGMWKRWRTVSVPVDSKAAAVQAHEDAKATP